MGDGRGTGLPPADTSSRREPARDGETQSKEDAAHPWHQAGQLAGAQECQEQSAIVTPAAHTCQERSHCLYLRGPLRVGSEGTHVGPGAPAMAKSAEGTCVTGSEQLLLRTSQWVAACSSGRGVVCLLLQAWS